MFSIFYLQKHFFRCKYYWNLYKNIYMYIIGNLFNKPSPNIIFQTYPINEPSIFNKNSSFPSTFKSLPLFGQVMEKLRFLIYLSFQAFSQNYPSYKKWSRCCTMLCQLAKFHWYCCFISHWQYRYISQQFKKCKASKEGMNNITTDGKIIQERC